MNYGHAKAHNARYERFTAQFGTELHSRRHHTKWCNRGSLLIAKPQKTTRRGSQFCNSIPHLESRVQRAMRAKQPLYGIHTSSELIDLIEGFKLTMLERRACSWAFIGVLNGIILTAITKPMIAAPVGAMSLSIDALPYEEIYLQHQSTLIVFCSYSHQLKHLTV